LLLAACADVEPQLDQIRSEHRQEVLLIRRIRERCMAAPAAPPEDSEPSSRSVPRTLATMEEPMRSVAAMFYAKIFPVAEIASILNLDLEEVADLLTEVRARLRGAGVIEPAHPVLPPAP